MFANERNGEQEMTKKLNILLIVFILVFTSACSTANNQSKDKITIWTWDPNYNVIAMEKAIEYYHKTHPDAQIEIVEFARTDVEQKLTSALLSNSKSELPDIVLIDDYNAPKFLASYPGAFADLTSEIDYSQFVQNKVATMTVDDKVYGVPFDSGVAALFYRHDILEEAGYKKADLENITWNQYIAIGKDVKEKTGKTLLAFNPNDMSTMSIMIQSASQWYTKPSGELNLVGNEVLIEALNTYKKFVDEGVITHSVDWSTWVSPVSDGSAASMPTGIWIMGTIKAAQEQSGLWSVAPIPRLENAKSVNASNLGGSSWYVLDSSDHKQDSIEFLNEIYAGNVDFYQDILNEIGAVGSYIPALSGSAYQYADPFFNNQQTMKDVSSWVQKIPAVDYGIYTNEIGDAIAAQMADFYSGKIDAAKVLEQADKLVAASYK